MIEARIKRKARQLLFKLRKPFWSRSLIGTMTVPKPIRGEDGKPDTEEADRLRRNFTAVIRDFAQDEKRFNISRELITTYYQTDITLLKRSFSPEEVSGAEVVVVSVIQNDILRCEVLLSHYRSLGVTHFLIMDQGSTDGTKEFLLEQPDVNLYFNNERYSATKKEAWVGRLIGTIGRGHWYLTADSDELVSYIGCEAHPIREAAAWLSARGFSRGKGVLADMYPKGNVIQKPETPSQLLECYCYFDADSYVVKDEGEFVSHLMGGPRPRKTGIMNEWVSKAPLFFYGNDTEVINSHFQFPLNEDRKAPYVFLMRHYKYFIPDRALFIQKEEHKVMQEFKNWATSNSAGTTDFYYPGSRKYEDSSSIRNIALIQEMF